MTIAIGFLCGDGVVLGVDTQMTALGSHRQRLEGKRGLGRGHTTHTRFPFSLRSLRSDMYLVGTYVFVREL